MGILIFRWGLFWYLCTGALALGGVLKRAFIDGVRTLNACLESLAILFGDKCPKTFRPSHKSQSPIAPLRSQSRFGMHRLQYCCRRGQ